MGENRVSIMWRWAQAGSLGLGICEVILLLLKPALGIHLLWNVLIPLAPLVFMLVPGVWRNVCPLGVVSQLPRRLHVRSGAHLSHRWQVVAIAAGWAALLIIVPMRHLWFDRSGPSTAVILVVLGTAALLLGLLFDGKSGWCSTCCPVHVVEKLYGQQTALPVFNAHCDTCTGCVTFCPDRHSGPDRLLRPNGTNPAAREAVGHLMIGGFAGFVYGWFQCPDLSDPTVAGILTTYEWPFGGMLVGLATYVVLLKSLRVPPALLSKVFAALAIATYYWFRIPMLLGFGRFGRDGCLADLSRLVPPAVIVTMQVAIVLLVFAWLVRGLVPLKPWMTGPRAICPPSPADSSPRRMPRAVASGVSLRVVRTVPR